MVIRIRKGSHIVFGCLLVFLITLLIARYSFNMDIPRIILTSIVILISIFGNYNEILAILFCCIPFHEAIDFYIALFACIVILIVKNHRLVEVKISIVCGIVMLFWELLHFFLYDSSFTSLVTAIMPIMALIMVLNLDASKFDYPFIVRAVAVASVTIGTTVLLNTIVQADFDFAKAVLNLQRLGTVSEDTVLIGGGVNPNAIGIINVLVVTGLLQLRSLNRQKTSDYILSIILVMFGVLTSSRTFFVCLLLMSVLLLFGQNGDTRKKIRFFVGLLVIALVVLLLMMWLFPSVLEYYIGRFQEEDITTGRNTLMSRYNSYIGGNLWVLFFGIGATDLLYKAVDIHQIAIHDPHNSIQEILLAWGIPGLLLIGFLIFIMVMESKRYSRRKTLLNFIPLIIILTKSMAGQLLTSGYTMLALGFAYLSLCQNFSSKNSPQLLNR